MVKRKTEIVNNLAQLQNLIKRDSASYQSEFDTQFRHFESVFSLFKLKPTEESIELQELLMFLSQVAPCFPKETKAFPMQIHSFLEENHLVVAADTRLKMVQALILMRNRNLIPQSNVLSLCFLLFRCKDKTLRVLLHSHIVSDIKTNLQNYMYKMLSDSSTIAAKKSLEVMIELYQKNIWNDTKTVNVIAEACLSDVPKLVAPSLHFFLGTNDAKVDEDEDIEVPDLTGLRHANTVNKKRKSRANTMEKAQAKVRRTERQRNKVEHFNFSALHLINDPQGFSEKLFQKLKKVSNKNVFNFELRLEMMNLISRLIGVHKLTLLGFYDFVISYIKPHQKNVTQILAFIAQASHELVPPDALENCIRAIADNFIWSNCAAEVITAGMNALREICTRCPLAMPEELLQSLLDDYKNHKDKGPMTAARALLGLFREFNPSMLKKKDRGKAASMSMKNLSQKSFGQVDLHNDVLGAELLQDESDSEEAPELVDGEFEEGDSWEEVDDEEELSEFEGDLDDLEEIEEELEEEEEEQGSPLKKVKLTKESWGTQKIFTDEDFAKIRERREEQEVNRLAGKKTRVIYDDNPDVVDADKIMAFTRRKDDYEARMESIKEGRIGREYGSKRGKDERASTTNKEKSKKNKPMTMLVHKRSVKGKQSRSLIEKQRTLRAHITKQKKKGH